MPALKLASVQRWANPADITVSLMPDGTRIYDGYAWRKSNLFAKLASVTGWRQAIRRAFMSWQKVCGVRFRMFVPDDGSTPGWGQIQGDTRFGDIRIGMIPLGGALGSTVYPPGVGQTGYGGTDHGDSCLSSEYTWHIGAKYELQAVMAHEAGHAIGLNHLGENTVMFGKYNALTRLTAADIAAARRLYGMPLAVV